MPQHLPITSHISLTTSQFPVMQHFNVPKLIRRKDYQSKSGEAAIILQVIFHQKRRTYNTNIKTKIDQWDTEKEKVILPGKKVEESQINLYLQNIKAHAISVIHRMMQMNIQLNINNFDNEFTRKEISTSFLSFIENYIAELKGVRAPETIKVYTTILNRLREFQSHIIFSDLTYDFIFRFDAHIRKKYKLNASTVFKYHKTVKTFINQSIRSGIRITTPYDKFIPKRKTNSNRPYHTIDELILLIELYKKNCIESHLQETLAAYLFSCIGGGYRISDLLQLTSDNIINGCVNFVAEKTKRSKGYSSIKLPEFAFNIISDRNGKLFNIPKYYANKNIRNVAWIAGLPQNKKISFHVARHTFATTYLMRGGKVENLQRILGHSKIETTMTYVHMCNSIVNQSMEIMDRITSD